MIRYWWVTTDRVSSEQHPGWIWNVNKRKPQFFGHSGKLGLSKGDYFVQAANRYFWEDASSGKHQILGLFQIEEECQGGKIPVPMIWNPDSVSVKDKAIVDEKAWVVKGRPLKQFGLRWRSVPPLKSLGIRLPFKNRLVNPITKSEFHTIKAYLTGKKVPRLGIMDAEPEYEQEVIALFLSNMHRFGYKKLIRLCPSFPDGRFLNKRGAEEEIEFELLASGLKEHEIEPNWRSVTYVCWHNDLKNQRRYKDLKIIALCERLT